VIPRFCLAVEARMFFDGNGLPVALRVILRDLKLVPRVISYPSLFSRLAFPL